MGNGRTSKKKFGKFENKTAIKGLTFERPDFFKMHFGKPVILRNLIKDDLRRNFGTNSFPPSRFYYLLLLDFWIGTLLINPLAISVVRGSWQNLDQVMEHLLPAKVFPRVATYVCYGVGCLASFSVSLINHYVDRRVRPDPSGRWLSVRQVRFFLASRLFTLCSLYSDICTP